MAEKNRKWRKKILKMAEGYFENMVTMIISCVIVRLVDILLSEWMQEYQ